MWVSVFRLVKGLRIGAVSVCFFQLSGFGFWVSFCVRVVEVLWVGSGVVNVNSLFRAFWFSW